MKNKLNQITLYILCSLIINSCEETEYSCGEIATKITELNQQVGTFNSNGFSNIESSSFEDAAIKIQISDVMIAESCNEEGFTPVPKIIESINITSNTNVLTNGAEYSAGESLNELFKLYRLQQAYTISEFITAQNNDPAIFSETGDQIILQLLESPDVTIDQSFNFLVTFTDSEILNILIPNFEVSN
jgi:hypothetical protein